MTYGPTLFEFVRDRRNFQDSAKSLPRGKLIYISAINFIELLRQRILKEFSGFLPFIVIPPPLKKTTHATKFGGGRCRRVI
jgi:hypothetical protein